MSSTLGVIRSTTLSLVFSVATLALASGEANAQYPGYGWGYDFPDTGFGGFAGSSFYGATGVDYGLSALGFPSYPYGGGQAYGNGYGVGGFDYGLSAFGFPNYGTTGGQAYGGGQDYGYGGTATAFPGINSLYGVGLTGIGTQGFVNDSNRTGRGQTAADRRAKVRKLSQQRGK